MPVFVGYDFEFEKNLKFVNIYKLSVMNMVSEFDFIK